MTTITTDRDLLPAEAARAARSQLSAAVALIQKQGFKKIRFDQYEHHCGTVVETGYVYGESRLTVTLPDGTPMREFKLTGHSLDVFNEFKDLVLV